MVEIWKHIEGYDNYVVSNFGKIVRIPCVVLCKNGMKLNYKRKVLNPEITKGYRRVTLSKNNVQSRFQVHRLVALAFIPNPDNKRCVNHKNGDKLCNFELNLEWCTYSENERHSYYVLGKINHNRKLSEEGVKDVRDNAKLSGLVGRNGGNVREYAAKYSVSITVIYNILKRKNYV